MANLSLDIAEPQAMLPSMATNTADITEAQAVLPSADIPKLRKSVRQICAGLSEEHRLVDTLRDKWPAGCKLLAAVERFNEYFFEFSTERMLNDRQGKLRKITYNFIDAHTALRRGQCDSKKQWMDSVGRMSTLGIEAVSREHPGEAWGVCEVPADGNCFLYSAAAFMSVSEPSQVELHFYDQFRHKLCDKLIEVIDAEKCAVDSSFTQLEFFQMQALGDVAADRTELPDISGRNPPTQGNYESVSEFREAVESYDKQWKEAREIVRANYVTSVEASRGGGVYNSGMHLVGLALVTNKIVELFSLAGDSFRLLQVYAAEGNDGTLLPLLFNPSPKGYEHYFVAIPLTQMETFEKPTYVAKQSMTHDSNGGGGEKRQEEEEEE
eukprot:gene23906-30184_t